MTRITLRAKSDPSVEITGESPELATRGWWLRLAHGVDSNFFSNKHWDEVIQLPTEDGWCESELYPTTTLNGEYGPYRLRCGNWYSAAGGAIDDERLAELMPLHRLGRVES